MKTILLVTATLAVFINLSAQTLFTYGGKPVSKAEFLQAFNKNPSADTVNRKTALQNYLNLYINYKLKVQAARDEKLDVTDEYRSESANFKKQLTDAAVNNEANLNSLVEEAYQRSQKDLNIDQLFIPVAAGGDTTAAYRKIYEIYEALKEGKALKNDTVKQTPIGFITAFTLPYEAESLVYSLKPGGFTMPYHSSAGYHIFLLKDERAALGKRKIQHILFAMPETFSDAEKAVVARKADSVYQLIKEGASFTEMQSQYSSQHSIGRTDMEVTVGQYNSDFENQVFALQKEGDMSKPFLTAYGYNIIRLTEEIPAAIDANDLTAKGLLQEKVEQDDRLSFAKQNLTRKWQITAGYKAAPYDTALLWKYTESALKGSSLAAFKTINKSTVLFSFARQKITVNDWLQYLQQQPRKGPYSQLMKQFVNYTTGNYYEAHIAEYNATIKPQLEEFNNANLLFAAMDKYVWTKASQDSAALQLYYHTNHTKYMWAPGADAIVVSAGTKEAADEVGAKIKADPAHWRDITASYGSMVQGDSSRFERDQLPVKQAVTLQKGYLSTPEQNDSHDAYSLIYITAVHPQPEQRSFEDARGLVINDYQQVAEAKWVAELKKKYPVAVNQQVFAAIQ